MRRGIALMRSELMDSDVGHLLRAPRWVPPRDGAKYWHVPRTAAIRPGGVARLTFWCGGARWVDVRTLTNTAPSENICGTCHGRALGYERGDGLVFRPRDEFAPPLWCPATGIGAGDDRFCAYCGGKRKFSRSYGGYNERRHAAGEGLSLHAPCPRHGWRWMRVINEPTPHLECRDWTGRRCGYVLEPAA